MDLSDLWIAVISAGSALIGAAVGGWATFESERANRESDRSQRCIDRFAEATVRLDAAFSSYNRAAISQDGNAADIAVAELNAAMRNYDHSVEMIDHSIIRTHAGEYREVLKAHYLRLNGERDPLDAGRSAPSAVEVSKKYMALTRELRRHASK